MARFLTTQGTSYYIEDIIRNAKNELVLISPFLQLSKTLFERLKDADRQNVKIYLIYGKDELKPEERKQLSQLQNLSLYFFQNLHAKCYFNEENMVITSMNMYEFSEKTNREMGVLVSARGDGNLFSDALKEAKSILDSATKEELSRSKANSYSYEKTQPGHCIRCGIPIPYNLDRPLCDEHFEVWAQYGDFNYPEKCCHSCGNPWPTNKAKPQCDSCYQSRR